MRYGNQINVPGAPGNFGGGAYSPFGGVYPMGNNQNGRDVVEEKRQEQFGDKSIPVIPGSSNVAGAIGNMGGMAMRPIGGSTPFTPAQEEQFQNWLQSPEGKRLQNLRERLNQQRGQASIPGAPGNLGAMIDANQLNASMYGGPQMGQAPDGFVNKFVS